MKFITPDVIRFINRKKRLVKTKFLYDQIQEVLDNESFARGAFQSAGSSTRTYDLLYWGVGKFPIVTVSNSQYGRMEEFDGAGRMIDNFAFITPDTSGDNSYIYSNPVDLEKGDKIDISFDVKYDDSTAYTGVAIHAFFILEVTPSFGYMLANDGVWIPTTSPSFGVGQVQIKYTDRILSNDYQSISITSQPLPDNGELTTYFIIGEESFPSPTLKRFKNLTQAEYIKNNY